MGRQAAKSAKVSDRHLTTNERESRAETESKLKGKDDKLIAPDYLSDTQKAIFNYVVTEMQVSGFFGNMDVFLLAQYSLCADRLIKIETEQNKVEDEKLNKELISARKAYSTDFLKYGLELGLSPQARAKVGIYAAEQRKADANPILGILNAK